MPESFSQSWTDALDVLRQGKQAFGVSLVWKLLCCDPDQTRGQTMLERALVMLDSPGRDVLSLLQLSWTPDIEWSNDQVLFAEKRFHSLSDLEHRYSSCRDVLTDLKRVDRKVKRQLQLRQRVNFAWGQVAEAAENGLSAGNVVTLSVCLLRTRCTCQQDEYLVRFIQQHLDPVSCTTLDLLCVRESIEHWALEDLEFYEQFFAIHPNLASGYHNTVSASIRNLQYWIALELRHRRGGRVLKSADYLEGPLVVYPGWRDASAHAMDGVNEQVCHHNGVDCTTIDNVGHDWNGFEVSDIGESKGFGQIFRLVTSTRARSDSAELEVEILDALCPETHMSCPVPWPEIGLDPSPSLEVSMGAVPPRAVLLSKAKSTHSDDGPDLREHNIVMRAAKLRGSGSVTGYSSTHSLLLRSASSIAEKPILSHPITLGSFATTYAAVEERLTRALTSKNKPSEAERAGVFKRVLKGLRRWNKDDPREEGQVMHLEMAVRLLVDWPSDVVGLNELTTEEAVQVLKKYFRGHSYEKTVLKAHRNSGVITEALTQLKHMDEIKRTGYAVSLNPAMCAQHEGEPLHRFLIRVVYIRVGLLIFRNLKLSREATAEYILKSLDCYEDRRILRRFLSSGDALDVVFTAIAQNVSAVQTRIGGASDNVTAQLFFGKGARLRKSPSHGAWYKSMTSGGHRSLSPAAMAKATLRKSPSDGSQRSPAYPSVDMVPKRFGWFRKRAGTSW
ncbi:MAG: uncharacterized protein KVP18_000100 [Porospora cf. gigantea A]|uniref:uncharacterized protein n=1 Tax=Porospora cf. gigantea A TaxID=2853593 RepID=UPI003559CB66|nr:MAG: hypothetical protein KVP18_000100 [Porospora cf. gigantea A]